MRPIPFPPRLGMDALKPINTIPLLKRLQWRMECLGHSLIELIAGLLPGTLVFAIGECMAGLAWHLMPKRRFGVIRNLRVAYGDTMSIDEIHDLAKTSFRRVGGNLLSAAHTARLSPAELAEVLRIENLELLEEALGKGRGVVLLLSHMGNWELLSRLIHFFPEGTKAGAMYRPLNNQFMDERVCARRQADGTRMFSKRDPFHQITGFLRGGGLVGVLADQRMGPNGDLVHFFGRLTRASPLPSLLARRAKSEVLALSMASDGPGSWVASFGVVESPPSSEHCAAALEAAMRRSPADVFWMQERWRVRLGREYNLQQLLEDRQSVAGKPHRALIWLDDRGDGSGLAPIWNHADVVYEVAAAQGGAVPEGLPEGTRVHPVEAIGSGECRSVLKSIDEGQTFPIDFVLTFHRCEALAAACDELGIPLYLHAAEHVVMPGEDG